MNIVQNCISGNNSHSLSHCAADPLAHDIFTEVGNKLQQRRLKDFIQNFGSHLTDEYRPDQDPALTDNELRKRLTENRKTGQKRLDEVIEKFVQKQEQSGADRDNEDDDNDDNDDDDNDVEPSDSDNSDSEKIDKVTSGGDYSVPPMYLLYSRTTFGFEIAFSSRSVFCVCTILPSCKVDNMLTCLLSCQLIANSFPQRLNFVSPFFNFAFFNADGIPFLHNLSPKCISFVSYQRLEESRACIEIISYNTVTCVQQTIHQINDNL